MINWNPAIRLDTQNRDVNFAIFENMFKIRLLILYTINYYLYIFRFTSFYFDIFFNQLFVSGHLITANPYYEQKQMFFYDYDISAWASISFIEFIELILKVSQKLKRSRQKYELFSAYRLGAIEYVSRNDLCLITHS